MSRRRISSGVYKRLPKPLEMLCSEFEGREKDVVLLSCLGVLSNCIPNIFGYYDRDKLYSHLYVVIIAPAASGKGVMNFSRILIEKIHEDALEQSTEAREECERRKEESEEHKHEKCPVLQIKILPANTSTAEMYYYLGSSKHGLVIIESEADTMSSMLKNDWSNYSDVLRKVFHHESISMSRKMEKTFIDINEPKLSMVISGTPEQLKPLIQSRENGLFSRLLIYSFDEIADFKNVFSKETKSTNKLFLSVGEKVSELYDELENIQSPVEFKFTEFQERRFFERFRYIRNNVAENHSESFLSSVHRHGVIMFRISMILTVLRNKGNFKNTTTLTCSDTDFSTALSITQAVLRHSQYTFDSIGTSFLSVQEEALLDGLTPVFTREVAITVGTKLNVPKRTIDDKLSQWQKKKIIKKLAKGRYKKL